VDLQVHDDAVNWCDDIGTNKHVLGGTLLLSEIKQLRLNLAQLLDGLVQPHCVEVARADVTGARYLTDRFTRELGCSPRAAASLFEQEELGPDPFS